MTPKSEMSKDQHGNQMPQMGSAILDTYLQFITENYGKFIFITRLVFRSTVVNGSYDF